MPKKPTGYYRPKNLDHALELIARSDTRILAGGTHLLTADVNAAVVDLQDLGLNRIEKKGDALVLGTMTRLSELEAFISDTFPSSRSDGPLNRIELLGRALRLAGPNTYRNAATVGGIIASRLADSELIAAMLLFNAQLLTFNPDEAFIALRDYLGSKPADDRLITEISLEWRAGNGAGYRVARTPADQPIVSVTVWKPEEEPIRVAATGIDKLPVRLDAVENDLPPHLDQESVFKSAEAAKALSRHPGDFRGDSSYRAEMAAVLTRRALSHFITTESP